MVTISDTGLMFDTSEYLLYKGTLRAPRNWHFPYPRAWFKPVVKAARDASLWKRYTHKARHSNGAVNRLNWWRDMAIKLGVLAGILNFYFITAWVLKGEDSAFWLGIVELSLICAAGFSGTVWTWLRFQAGRHTVHHIEEYEVIAG